MTETQRRVLAAKLVEVRKQIEEWRQRLQRLNEQDTKATLIEPVLSALGWDIRNPDEISREYRRKSQDNPVDFAIFLLRSPCLFIEAKALDTDLADRRWISQAIAYATTVGVEWCVLTNGDEFRLYNVHAAVDVDEKLFRRVQVSDASGEAHTLDTLYLLSKDNMGEKRLNVLWNAHFVDRRVKSVLDDLFKTPDKSLVTLVRKRTDGLLSRSEVEMSLKRADVRTDFPVIPTVPQVPPARPATGEPSERPAPEKPRRKSRPADHVTLSNLIEAGIVRPPLNLEVTYKKVRLTATVQIDGTVLFEGKTYTSLSVAGGVARTSVKGPPADGRPSYQTNGWTFWRYRNDTTGNIEPIDILRRLFLDRGKKTSPFLVVGGAG